MAKLNGFIINNMRIPPNLYIFFLYFSYILSSRILSRKGLLSILEFIYLILTLYIFSYRVYIYSHMSFTCFLQSISLISNLNITEFTNKLKQNIKQNITIFLFGASNIKNISVLFQGARRICVNIHKIKYYRIYK